MSVNSSIWDEVMELTKSAQSNGTDASVWAVKLSSMLLAAGIVTPSTEVAELLVEHIVCWSNNVPIVWKYLEKAIVFRIAPPMLFIALLSNSVIPSRRSQPAAYRLYLELLRRHIFPLAPEVNGPKYGKIMESINDALHLTQRFGILSSEPGFLLVEFVFAIVWQLLDASLDDEGLLELVPDKKSIWPIKPKQMEIDDLNIGDKKVDRNERLYKTNTTLAIEIIGELYKNRVTSRMLYLARRNMPIHWGSFSYNLTLLAANSLSLRNSKDITSEALLQLLSDNDILLSREFKTSLQQFRTVLAAGSLVSSAGASHGAGRSAIWLPIDLFLEDTIERTVIVTTNAAETLTGLLKAHQAITQASWQEAFLGLWIAALRLVQRVKQLNMYKVLQADIKVVTEEADAVEGPIHRLNTSLCLLLCTTTLAIGNIVDEEESALVEENDRGYMHVQSETDVVGICHKSLISCLQQLGDFEGLLTPPPSVISSANEAAAKAIMCISSLGAGNGYVDSASLIDMPGISGDLRHLIVEACIARHLLDTKAYMWPGYVKGHTKQVSYPIAGQTPGWSSLMKGSSLTPSMVHALVSTPASSLAEIEKIYGIATDGSDAEKISAATILCGASLTHGWNIQEHAGLFIIKLLTPPVPQDYTGSGSHLLACAPILNVLLMGISSIDCLLIFSLHGLVAQLAGVLMPICEVFGSCSPTVSWSLPTGEHLCPRFVFSNGFTLLLKLWRFDQPPLEHAIGDATPVGSQLTPEYLLLVRNSQLSSCGNSPKNQKKRKRSIKECDTSSMDPIFLDSFPKLKLWYRQHQACIASTLSDPKPGTSVYQIFDALMSMMLEMIKSGGQTLTSSTSGSSKTSGSAAEDCIFRLKLPAWDILDAVPFVLDAALRACEHGRMSPRELTKGLRALADFFPASMATIVSYLSAETTRGLWKPASMNGTDWPSPATNLSMVEQNLNKILASTGVDVPSLSSGGASSATLPLPLAALVSLTITYPVDGFSESVLNLAGPALNTLGAGCPWPCMAIIAALWIQKAKRWTDFLVFSASKTIFRHNNDAIVQLLRVCFQSTLGLNSPPIIPNNSGVGNLLGHGFVSDCSGGIAPVAPGILYLRVHRSVRDVMFMTEEIISLLMLSIKDILSIGIPVESCKRPKNGTIIRYGEVSLSVAMTRIRLAACLGASLLWITGGVNMIQNLIKEILPSWFISVHRLDINKVDSGGMIGMLKGYALAYFTVLSGAFAWGVDSASLASKKRPVILGSHLEFMAKALDGKILLGCNKATWQAYVSGFVGLMVSCTPKWVCEVDVEVLKSLSKGLRKGGEEDLALALLGIGGLGAMGTAAEFIVASSV